MFTDFVRPHLDCKKKLFVRGLHSKIKMSIDISETSNLDSIFSEVGEFGIFQITSYLLIFIPNVLSSTFVIGYMFAAKSLDYRWADFLWSLSFFADLTFYTGWIGHRLFRCNACHDLWCWLLWRLLFIDLLNFPDL